jgi:hypothetical protein
VEECVGWWKGGEEREMVPCALGSVEQLSGGGREERRRRWRMTDLSDGGMEERSRRWCPVHCVAEELLGGGWVAEDLSGGGREREEKRAGGGAWKNCQMVERRSGDGALCVG